MSDISNNTYKSKDDIIWSTKGIDHISDTKEGPIFRYYLELPDFLAEWDAPSRWESGRMKRMGEIIKPDNILYEIGAERGWQTAVYAKYFVKPGNLVLVEPSKDFWSLIKEIWEHNFGGIVPKFNYAGLLSDQCNDIVDFAYSDNHGYLLFHAGLNLWPIEAYTKPICESLYYRTIIDHINTIPAITLDKLVDLAGTPPDIISMDVEGAEYKVLKGGSKTIANHKPIFFVSIHEELLIKNGSSYEKVDNLMNDYDYSKEFIDKDHEIHVMYSPK